MFFNSTDIMTERDLNYKIAICVIQVILCFTALLGNSAILITLLKTPSLHTAANILLTSLAVTDLAVGLVTHPLFIANVLSEEPTVHLVLLILGPFLSIASFVTVTAIGVDRFLALQLHLRYKTVVTPFRVTLVVVFIWVFAGVFASMELWISKLSGIISSIVIVSLLVGNFIVYLKIYLIVHRHQTQIQRQQQQQQPTINENIFSVKRFKKTALNTFLVFILLVCCYMPQTVVVKMAVAGVSIAPRVYNITITLVCLNSSLNPLLYCWRDREIRTAMKQLFYC